MSIFNPESTTPLSVMEILECRRRLYQEQLAKFGLPQPLARRIWTTESDYLDITANLVIGRPAKALTTQHELRTHFFSTAISAPEVLDMVLLLGSRMTVDYVKALSDTGLISDFTTKLSELEDIMETSRYILLGRASRDGHGALIYDYKLAKEA